MPFDDLDELQELLKEARSDGRLGDHRDQFLKDIGAEPDPNTKTKAVVIYWIYLKWCRQKAIDPIHRKSFFRGLHRLFKHKYIRLNWYYIRSQFFIISKEEKKLMLEHLKKENEFYKWRREKQKKEKLQRKLLRERKLSQNDQIED